jgi:hypothetical protein
LPKITDDKKQNIFTLGIAAESLFVIKKLAMKSPTAEMSSTLRSQTKKPKRLS